METTEQAQPQKETPPEPWQVLDRLMGSLSFHDACTVREMRGQAIGYAWGYQDAGGDTRDSSAAWNFGTAYAIHAAEYAAEVRPFRRNIPDSYKAWRKDGEC